MGGDEANAIEKRGAEIVAIDLDGPRDALVAALRNHDVVISAIRAWALDKQIPLVDAAKEAGVARFVPCDFGTVCPPGVMSLRDRVWLSSLLFLQTGLFLMFRNRKKRFTTI